MATCKKCKAKIEFMKTKAGKPMPVNPDKKTIILPSGEVVSGWESHFATCEFANEFRKTGKQGGLF